jgi:LacI family transcriptional regulator
MNRTQPPTIGDIATRAGAAPIDVALAMAGDDRLDPDLRCRITDLANELGYAAFAAPQAVAGRPLRIALVFKTFRGDDPDANRFYAPMSSAISIACARSGVEVHHTMMTVDAHYKAIDIPTALLNGSVDAAFVFGVDFEAELAARLRQAPCRVVMVDGYASESLFDSVDTDNVAGATAMVERLIRAGHRHIALLGTEPACYPSVLDRRRGYLEAIRNHGLSPHLIDISYVLTHAGAVLGLDYVERHPEVTALFGANDLLTVSFMQLARDAGYRLPADLSVAGFDDIDLAALVMPALTTMRIDRTQMARAALALLAYRLEEPDGPLATTLIRPSLVERDSVSAPPQV